MLEVEESSPSTTWSEDYRRRSPGISLQPTSRYVKRFHNRSLQRAAALQLALSPKSPATSSPVKVRNLPPAKILTFPVIEPSVSLLDNFDAQEWVRVQRKKNVQNARSHIFSPRSGTARRHTCDLRSVICGRSQFQNIQGTRPSRHEAKRCAFVSVGQKGHISGPQNKKAIASFRQIHVNLGLPAPVPRVSSKSSAPSSLCTARACPLVSMAGRNLVPPRAGGQPTNPPLRQPHVALRNLPITDVPPRGPAGRVDVPPRAVNGGQDGRGGQSVHPSQPRPDQQNSRFEFGSSSSGGGGWRDEGSGSRWRDEGTGGQGFGGAGGHGFGGDFGDFDQGYYEGNHGFNNGYGANNQGNFRPRQYRPQFYNGYRGRNNYRGNGGRYRYQRSFSNHANINQNEEIAPVENVVQHTTPSLAVVQQPLSQRTISNDTSSAVNLVATTNVRVPRKPDKTTCFKSGETGHFADACPDVLCIYCEKITHAAKECPLLSMPKPVAVTYGVCRNDLIFHEVPASSEITFKHDSGKVGRISVVGGTMTAQEVVRELEWILPVDHQWDLSVLEDGAFKTIFPSKLDLARMTKIINVPVQDTDMLLHFEEWSAADLDKFTLAEVWVRVHGCCHKERCDYLALFAVGSLIGKTKEVDMEFTRSHSAVRMKVEVTRVEHIPKTSVDHRYEGEGYGLLCKVEENIAPTSKDVIMDDADSDENKKKNGDESNNDKHNLGNESIPGGMANASGTGNLPKDQSGSVMGAKQVSSVPIMFGSFTSNFALSPQQCTRSEGRLKLIVPRRLWGDCDVDDDSLPSPLPCLGSPVQQLDESQRVEPSVACNIAAAGGLSVAEIDNMAAVSCSMSVLSAGTEYSAGLDASRTGPLFHASVEEPRRQEHVEVSLSPISLSANVSEQEDWLHSFSTPVSSPTLHADPSLSPGARPGPLNSQPAAMGLSGGQGPSAAAGTGVFLGGRFSVNDVVTYGGIPAASTDVRSSSRIRSQANADASQMKRAQQLAHAKDDASCSGTKHPSNYSLSSFSDDAFLHRAKSLGVSLGDTPSKITAMISKIKNDDDSRTLIILQKNLEEKIKKDAECPDNNETLVHALALATDLSEEEQQGSREKESPVREVKRTKVNN